MSTKITDARIEELERLKQRKEDLIEKIQRRKDEMKEIRDAMDRGETAGIMLSSSAAALSARGKEPSNFTNDELLEIEELVIERLEEQLSEVEIEIDGLKD